MNYICGQGGRPGLDDLAGLDHTLHASCLAIKSCPPDQVEHLGLTFIAEQQLFGKVWTQADHPNGAAEAALPEYA